MTFVGFVGSVIVEAQCFESPENNTRSPQNSPHDGWAGGQSKVMLPNRPCHISLQPSTCYVNTVDNALRRLAKLEKCAMQVWTLCLWIRALCLTCASLPMIFEQWDERDNLQFGIDSTPTSKYSQKVVNQILKANPLQLN